MKKLIFKIFRKLFRLQLIKFCLHEYPLEITTEKIYYHYKIILVKKGKIKEWRSYDENHKRIYNLKINSFGNVVLNK